VAAVPLHQGLQAVRSVPFWDRRRQGILRAELPASDPMEAHLSPAGVLAAAPNGGWLAGNDPRECAYSVYMVHTRYFAVQA